MAELRAMPPEEVERLAAEEEGREQEERRQQALAADARLGFGAAWAAAEFDHWSRCAYWSLDEALALMAGMEPGRTSLMAITMAATSGASPAAVRFERMRDLAQRAKKAKLLADNNVPGVFLAWAKRSGIAIPPALEAAVTAHGVVIADWRTLYEKANELAETRKAVAEKREEQTNQRIADLTAQRDRLAEELETVQAELAARDAPLSPTARGAATRERETLLKLVIGMAVDGYGYNPKDKRSPIANQIAGHLNALDISMTDDTVRKWLQEAAMHLPSERLGQTQDR